MGEIEDLKACQLGARPSVDVGDIDAVAISTSFFSMGRTGEDVLEEAVVALCSAIGVSCILSEPQKNRLSIASIFDEAMLKLFACENGIW